MSTPGEPVIRDEAAGEAAASPPRQLRISLKLRARQPVATFVLGGLTVLVYLLQLASQTLFQEDIPLLLGAQIPALVYSGQFWRLITPVFLHGSILHLGLNMWMLYILGRTIEPHYGHKRFVLLFLASALAGNVFSLLVTNRSAIGAATALFGLLAAEGVLILQNRAVMGDRARGSLVQIAVIMAINLAIGLVPGFESWGGIGGSLGGLAFAWFAGPVWGVRAHLFEAEIEDTRGDGKAGRVFLIEALVLAALVAQRILLK